MVTVISACLLTPWDDVIRVHFGVNVVNFHNEEVEINSLDQHPTESGHQEILHQSCYCNTGSLWKERVFVYLWRSFRQDIYGATGKFIPWIEKGATNFVFCGVYSGEEDDLSSSKGHRNTQSNLRERLTSIFVKKQKESMRQSNNNINNNWMDEYCFFLIYPSTILQRFFNEQHLTDWICENSIRSSNSFVGG